MRTAAVVGLLGDEHSNLQLDASRTAWDRRLLTSIVILPSDFGRDLCELIIRMVETSLRGSIFWYGSSMGSEGISISRSICLLAIRLILLSNGSGRVVIMGSSCPFKPRG